MAQSLTRDPYGLSGLGDWEGLAAAILERAWLDWWVQRHYFYCTVCGSRFSVDGGMPKRLKCATCRGQKRKVRGSFVAGDMLSTVHFDSSGYAYRNILGRFFKGYLFCDICSALGADPWLIEEKMKKTQPVANTSRQMGVTK